MIDFDIIHLIKPFTWGTRHTLVMFYLNKLIIIYDEFSPFKPYFRALIETKQKKRFEKKNK